VHAPPARLLAAVARQVPDLTPAELSAAPKDAAEKHTAWKH